MDSIRVICAWCGKMMSGWAGADMTSHGICRPCLALQMGMTERADEWSMWVDVGGEG